jgi:hypothetical protein
LSLRTNNQYPIKKSSVYSTIQTKDGFMLHAAAGTSRSSRNELEDNLIFKILINCKKDEEKFQLEQKKKQKEVDSNMVISIYHNFICLQQNDTLVSRIKGVKISKTSDVQI